MVMTVDDPHLLTVPPSPSPFSSASPSPSSSPCLPHPASLCCVQCSEWGQIFILDVVSTYTPPNAAEADNILDRVKPRLQHANSAVRSSLPPLLHSTPPLSALRFFLSSSPLPLTLSSFRALALALGLVALPPSVLRDTATPLSHPARPPLPPSLTHSLTRSLTRSLSAYPFLPHFSQHARVSILLGERRRAREEGREEDRVDGGGCGYEHTEGGVCAGEEREWEQE
eukprot:927387-Rhodomonas_salina.1